MRYKLKDTKELYSIDSEKYTKERHALHRKIVRRLEMKGSTPIHGKKPIAILMGGGTASGKTTIRKNIIEKELNESNIATATVDLDEIKEYIPEFADYKMMYPDQAARLVHKESCDIGALLLDRLIKKRKNFIYEGTMARTRKYKWLVKKLKKHHYMVHAYIVDVPLSIAIERADERAQKTGRKVPHKIIKNTHKLVPRTFNTIKDLVDDYRVYDNQKEELILITSSTNMVDPEKFEEFLSKRKRHRTFSNKTDLQHSGKINLREYNMFIDDGDDSDMLKRYYP